MDKTRQERTPGAGASHLRTQLLRAAPVALITMLTMACSDAVGPKSGDAGTMAPAKLQNTATLGAMVDDVVQRILPALPAEYGESDLGPPLQQLWAAIEDGGVAKVSDALNKANAALDRTSARAGGDESAAAALSEVRLALSVVSDAISPGSAP